MTYASDDKKRLVVKIGSSTLTTSDSSIDRGYMRDLTRQIAQLKCEGWQVVIVSSGAIACGLGRLGVSKRPSDMPTLQAAASVGQSELAGAYSEFFSEYDVVTSLVLLTRRDTADRESYLHARDTFDRLLDLGVVPIVNENDTVSIEQIRFGDNDSLAALVSCLIDATLLVIASDIDGLYDANPAEDADAKLISEVRRIDKGVMSVAGGAGSVAGSGGMLTKVRAARVMMAAGIPMAIVNGKSEDALIDAAEGRCPGTLFASAERPHSITPKKLWLALGDSSRGSLVIDEGAKRALIRGGGSLLCVGVRQANGSFEEGDIVDIEDEEGLVVGRGKVQAGKDEVSLAMGRTSEELASNRLLSYMAERPVVHRDDLIMFE